MATHVIEITKIIVVEVEADTTEEAMQIARDDTDGFDGAWDHAENNVELLDIRED